MMETDEEASIAASVSQDVQRTIAITWDQLVQETSADPILSQLVMHFSNNEASDFSFPSEFTRYKDALYANNGVMLYKDRVIVPPKLRQLVLQSLHSAHQGASSMEQRAQAVIFWPGMSYDIIQTRARCDICNRNAPSQAALPSEPAVPPSTPFEKVFADYFYFAGRYYLVLGDRLSGWSEVFATPQGSSYFGAKGLLFCLRKFFSVFGVPVEISSDGGPEFIAKMTADFLSAWDVSHRISSAHHSQSNGRAEVAVKSAKRLLRSNVGMSGSLDNDNFLRAMLQLRNTPDPDCKISPAEIIFGRPLRDSFAFLNRLEKFSNPAVRSTWREAWRLKEEALRARFAKTSEKLNETSKYLPPLQIGDRCLIQNQYGNHPKKWDRSGKVVEVYPFDQYMVLIDGSRRLTKRNRKFLKKYTPPTASLPFSAPLATPTLAPPSTVTPNITEDLVSDAPQVVTEDLVSESDAPQVVTKSPVKPGASRFSVAGGDGGSQNSRQAMRPRKLPLSLRQLQDYNAPGLEETTATPPRSRLRPRH